MTDRWQDRAAAYALGALDPEDERVFEARLAEDEALRRLVDEYRAAAAAIGTSVPQREPPPGLRDRVLRRAREIRPDDGVTGAGRIDADSPAEEPESRGKPYARRGSRLPWVGLAAAAAGLVWLGLENRELRVEAASLEAEVAAIRAELGAAEGEIARLDSITPLLAASDVRFATLTAEGAEPGLRLLWSPERRVLVVAATNLPAPPEGRTYQLWGIRGTASPVSLGTFETGPTGDALLTLAPDVADANFDLSAITEEPAGGSPQPTSQPFLAGPWTSAQE